MQINELFKSFALATALMVAVMAAGMPIAAKAGGGDENSDKPHRIYLPGLNRADKNTSRIETIQLDGAIATIEMMRSERGEKGENYLVTVTPTNTMDLWIIGSPREEILEIEKVYLGGRVLQAEYRTMVEILPVWWNDVKFLSTEGFVAQQYSIEGMNAIFACMLQNHTLGLYDPIFTGLNIHVLGSNLNLEPSSKNFNDLPAVQCVPNG